MAYTYDDFTKAADSAGVLSSFDQNDLDYAKKYPEFGLSMVSLKRDLGNATTDEQKLLATEAMNQLRKNYGSYWTGDAGSRSYATSYGSKIDDTMKKIDNYEDFKYDPNTDPLYADYKKAYLREGSRAAANALAQSAAATGGMASSYANTAAQQAANYYAGKVADAIPTLRAQALDEYNSAIGKLRSDLSMLQGQDNTDYSRYLDMLNAEYQRDRDAVADAQQELQNALQIYELTKQITGPLKDLLGTAVKAKKSGGGGGGGYYVGGGDEGGDEGNGTERIIKGLSTTDLSGVTGNDAIYSPSAATLSALAPSKAATAAKISPSQLAKATGAKAAGNGSSSKKGVSLPTR